MLGGAAAPGEVICFLSYMQMKNKVSSLSHCKPFIKYTPCNKAEHSDGQRFSETLCPSSFYTVKYTVLFRIYTLCAFQRQKGLQLSLPKGEAFINL